MTTDRIYKVTITEINPDDEVGNAPIYEQIVEQLDIKAVIDAVNAEPRMRAPRSDRGKKRTEQMPAADAPI